MFEVIRTPLDQPHSDKTKEVMRFDKLDSAYTAALALKEANETETRRNWKVGIKDTDRNVFMDLTK